MSAAAALLLAGFDLYFYSELTVALSHLPIAYYITDQFSAANLPLGLSSAFGHTLAGFPVSGVVWALLLGLSAIHLFAIVRWRAFRCAFSDLAPVDAALMLVGSAVVSGCFFAGQNVGYRGIYLLLLLPGLLVLWRDAADCRVRKFAIQTSLSVLFLMWCGALTWNGAVAVSLRQHVLLFGAVWFLREFVWWRVVATLVGVVFCFVIDSARAEWARMRFRGSVAS